MTPNRVGVDWYPLPSVKPKQKMGVGAPLPGNRVKRQGEETKVPRGTRDKGHAGEWPTGYDSELL